ncbi:hypothetical protein CWATWH0402_1220 [Crocosphaera watsonii WH 0402]|uniref:Uncharacterized protein n=2 Tax=Crocosphaera watsonii TaxID=263511 RepID=T2JJD7_CROWT|nr:hypothetical protein CWATWH0401_2243 [Crocosphaera watsonii WH 0401]CCQ65350.1 hypothetical protein CWATWH0402_1220 [Crocosphaera watsonii WH 0402]
MWYILIINRIFDFRKVTREASHFCKKRDEWSLTQEIPEVGRVGSLGVSINFYCEKKYFF